MACLPTPHPCGSGNKCDTRASFAAPAELSPDAFAACDAACAVSGPTRPVEVVHHSRPRVPYVPRDASSAGVEGELPDSTTLYDCTHVVGGFRSYKGLRSSAFWTGEFTRVVELLAPVVRHATQSDFFYNALSSMPTGNKLQPRGWVTSTSYPPRHARSDKPIGRFGFRVVCDHTDRSGCDEWLEIHREYDLFPEAAVYSVTLSNGVHRLACNHCLARPNDQSAHGTEVPALHPAIELFMRVKVRECAEGGHPRITMTRMLPMIGRHLRETSFLHCGRRLPEPDESMSVAKKKGACTHQFTYEALSRMESGYFKRSGDMPAPVLREENKRQGLGPRKKVMRKYNSGDPVTIHHMMLRRGDCPHGRVICESRQKGKIADKLLDLNATFMREKDMPQVQAVRPADCSMPAIQILFEKGNLFRAWNEYTTSIDANIPCNFDVYQWRLIGILYRKKTKREMRDGASTGAVRNEDGSLAPLAIEDFQHPPHQSCKRRTEREFEMVLVMGSIASLFSGLKAWACRQVTQGVVLGMDHMYNVLRGVANVSLICRTLLLVLPSLCSPATCCQCYLFNVGVTCAKGTHHPTVGALQVGKGLLRNEAVGSVWHHAVEWLRHNASAVAEYMLRSAVSHNIRLELGLPDVCFADSGQGRELEEAGWTKAVGSLGDMVHAFPRVKFDVSSFQRIPEEPCFLTGMTDGDRPMFQGVVNGLGDGLAQDNRNGIPTTNNACSFHKGKNIEGMFTDILTRAKMLRSLNEAEWDRTWGLGSILSNAPRNIYQQEFGGLFDVVMQHDSLPVTLGVWELYREKGTHMGLAMSALDHLDLHHHPVNGRQGHHGRSSQRREVALGHVVGEYSLGGFSNGEWYEVDKGTTSSANSLEARINAALKRLLGHAMRLDDLLPALSEGFSEVCLKCCGELQYSCFPDFLGQCPGTTHKKKSGRAGSTKTGRDFRTYFHSAEADALDHRERLSRGEPTPTYHLVSGSGRNSVYVVASERTIKVAKAMVDRNAAKPLNRRLRGMATVDAAVATLRCSWESYMKNPQVYADKLAAEARTWRVGQARDHLLDDQAFGPSSRYGAWGPLGPTPAQVHVIVEADVLYNAQAFYRIVPRAHYTAEEAKPYLQEQWRDYSANDPWCTDLGFFECQHCSQFSKTGYCQHVAAVTMIENILPGVPRCMLRKGVGSNTWNAHAKGPTRSNKYNTEVTVDSPERMRWSAQQRNRSKTNKQQK